MLPNQAYLPDLTDETIHADADAELSHALTDPSLAAWARRYAEAALVAISDLRERAKRRW
jgi:hypothetical protein